MVMTPTTHLKADMDDQVTIFRAWKEKVQQYPSQKFPFGYSPCCWFTPPMQQFFTKFFASLPPNSIYLELGTFLGAGSTIAALQANSTLLAVCADDFRFTRKVAKTALQGIRNERGKPVAFLRGRGNAFQHFINNTWSYRDRIAISKVDINEEFLRRVFASGLKPTVIYIDDKHTEPAVKLRLRVIKELWSDAIVLLDDYLPGWQGVIDGVQYAFKTKLYDEAKSKLMINRIMVLNPPPWL